ncbi:GNAT family N-acetyltransferase [Caenibacillus caldisaponilyticus]|uniref:GNAT family N-acetyltransferase n=1 Tax=Caenibacillus caldisaponilyticus TaxID=1674942 RepID=UPI00117834D3|nr:GNAT family protein [Caenibacillus caldisaponilyticus]
MLKGNRVVLKPIEKSDIPVLYERMHAKNGEIPEWKKWDAPYFSYRKPPYRTFRHQMLQESEQGKRWVILKEGEIIGMVTYYWEHQPSYWLEIGIVIFDPIHWNGGYGTEAFFLWIDHLFKTMPIVRIGFTTWSGNERMLKVGEKLGMVMEARIRKCRLYQGQFYDSVRYGMLREEWEEKRPLLKKKILDGRPVEATS